MDALPQLWVWDTNVALDWLVFDDPAVRDAVRAVESRRGARLVTSAECFSELQRVLAYPRLALDAGRQAAALARYVAHTTVFLDFGEAPSGLPLCSDADDQKFLELAWHAGAHVLVTKDKALLGMAGRVGRLGRFRIAAPTALVAWPTALVT
jgi:predicted nucleic acid-binding protein